MDVRVRGSAWALAPIHAWMRGLGIAIGHPSMHEPVRLLGEPRAYIHRRIRNARLHTWQPYARDRALSAWLW
jgi:hypothetical protein